MIIGERVQGSALAPPTSPQALSIASLRYRLIVYAACTAATLIANYLLGKDLAWDTLNYHLYAGFSALNDRFAQDYFAAGAPSYFNPYAYVPFYAMVHTGLSSLTISSIFALVHSVIFWLTFELALCVCPSNDRLPRLIFGICAIILAAVNPILIQQIGSTFADITTAELLLGGWLLLAQAVSAPTRARVICAGLLLGVATALKPTNSVHAISAFALFIMFPLDLWGRLRQGIVCGLSAGAGFAIVAAPWSYSLYRMFGNPMFPLMNNVFRSPEFTTEPLRHFRFIPFSLGEALWRPFAIVDPVRMVQEELSSPDLRYAVLVVLVFVLIVRWGWRRFSRRPKLPTAEGSIVSGRVLAALGCGFGVDWVMWLSASGNGRYFLPMACIASVLPRLRCWCPERRRQSAETMQNFTQSMPRAIIFSR